MQLSSYPTQLPNTSISQLTVLPLSQHGASTKFKEEMTSIKTIIYYCLAYLIKSLLTFNSWHI